MLNDSKELLAEELNRLNTELADLEASSTASDEERSTLSLEKTKLKEASAVVSSYVGNLEKIKSDPTIFTRSVSTKDNHL